MEENSLITIFRKMTDKLDALEDNLTASRKEKALITHVGHIDKSLVALTDISFDVYMSFRHTHTTMRNLALSPPQLTSSNMCYVLAVQCGLEKCPVDEQTFFNYITTHYNKDQFKFVGATSPKRTWVPKSIVINDPDSLTFLVCFQPHAWSIDYTLAIKELDKLWKGFVREIGQEKWLAWEFAFYGTQGENLGKLKRLSRVDVYECWRAPFDMISAYHATSHTPVWCAWCASANLKVQDQAERYNTTMYAKTHPLLCQFFDQAVTKACEDCEIDELYSESEEEQEQ